MEILIYLCWKSNIQALEAVQEQRIVVWFPVKRPWDFELNLELRGKCPQQLKVLKIGGYDTLLIPYTNHSQWRGQLKTGVAVQSHDYECHHYQPYPMSFSLG